MVMLTGRYLTAVNVVVHLKEILFGDKHLIKWMNAFNEASDKIKLKSILDKITAINFLFDNDYVSNFKKVDNVNSLISGFTDNEISLFLTFLFIFGYNDNHAELLNEFEKYKQLTKDEFIKKYVR